MGEEMEIGRRIEGWLVRIAQAISSACNFVSIRLDYYVEMKQHEFEVRHKTFPKEWFEDTPTEEDVASVDEIQSDLKDDLYKDYNGNPNFVGDD